MKKLLALVLVFMLAISSTALAAEFKDMPNDWSTAALTAAVENGLLSGNDGYLLPSDNMTRAEMATIMARACGATAQADISEFSDVKADDWFYSSVAKAVAMKAFAGADGKFNPDNPITRQEAFLVLSRVFGLAKISKPDVKILDTFKDGAKVDDWAREGVATIISMGYVAGNDGYLNPLDNISRAEFAVVMDRLIKYYVDDSAEAIPTDGNVMIRAKGIDLAGLTTDKMVVIGDGAGAVDFDFKDVAMNGSVIVRGGKTVTATGHITNVAVIMPNITLSADTKVFNSIYVGSGSTYNIPTILLPEGVDLEGAEAAEDSTEATETADAATEDTAADSEK